MKKFVLTITLGIGAFAFASAQTAATSTQSSNSTAPKACCQKGGDAKAGCSKDAKASSASTPSCHGSAKNDASKAEVASPASTGRTEQRSAAKTTTTTK